LCREDRSDGTFSVSIPEKLKELERGWGPGLRVTKSVSPQRRLQGEQKKSHLIEAAPDVSEG
jgi:hypothetical protein